MRNFLTYFFFFVIITCAFGQEKYEVTELDQDKAEIKAAIQNRDLAQIDRIDKLHELAELYYGESKDSAHYYLNSALQLSKLRNDSLKITQTYIKLGLAEVYTDTHEDALAYIDSSYQYANVKDARFFIDLGEAYSIEGIVYNNYEQMDVAFEKILQANRYLSKSQSTERTDELFIENYGDLAIIYFNIEEYENAIKNASKAIQLATDAGIDYNIADNYNMLGSIYQAKEDFSLAQSYLDSAAVAFKAVKSDEGLIAVANERGQVYEKLKKYALAQTEFQQALTLSKEVDDLYLLTTNYLDLGHIYASQGDFDMAKKYVDSSLQYSEKLGIPIFSGEIALLRTQILSKEGNIPGAIDVLRQNVGYLESQNLQESKLEAYAALYRLYKSSNDLPNSLTYYERYSQLRDSLREKLQNSKLNVLRVEHNYNQLVSTLENTETQLALANEAKRRVALRNTFLVIGGLLVLLFAIFMFLREKKLNSARRMALESKQEVLKLKQEALDNEVTFKNKQITNFAIHISEKNELLEKIKIKLKKIKVTNDTYKEMVNDTLHFINNDIEQNKEKIQLYQNVNETNDSFGAKIDNLYSNLSDKEKKVAIMLRLGQTSKQIALQLNISAASVDNYRYSLRKKMEIPKGQSLKVFIQNL